MSFKRLTLTHQQAQTILRNGRWGVLSTATADGVPYGVPINYGYDEAAHAIYCHCAPNGRKLDNIAANSAVSFTVVASETLLEDAFISNYRSVIVQGRAQIITDAAAKEAMLQLLCAQLTPSTTLERRAEVIAQYLTAVRLIKIDILSLSGKENQDT